MRVSLADAARITGRQDATIRGWILTKQLAADEARRTSVTGARLRTWSIDLDAVERVHRAHGGTYWSTDVLQRERVPSYITERLQHLEQLEAEVVRLQRLVQRYSDPRYDDPRHDDPRHDDPAPEHTPRRGTTSRRRY